MSQFVLLGGLWASSTWMCSCLFTIAIMVIPDFLHSPSSSLPSFRQPSIYSYAMTR